MSDLSELTNELAVTDPGVLIDLEDTSVNDSEVDGGFSSSKLYSTDENESESLVRVATSYPSLKSDSTLIQFEPKEDLYIFAST